MAFVDSGGGEYWNWGFDLGGCGRTMNRTLVCAGSGIILGSTRRPCSVLYPLAYC